MKVLNTIVNLYLNGIVNLIVETVGKELPTIVNQYTKDGFGDKLPI